MFSLLAGLTLGTTSASANGSNGTLMMIVEFMGDDYFVTNAWTRPEAYPEMNERPPLPDDIIVHFLDASYQPVMSKRVRNPRFSRSSFDPNTTDENGDSYHQYHKKQQGSFTLRFPMQSNIKMIQINESSAEISPSRKSLKTSSGLTVKAIDVSKYFK